MAIELARLWDELWWSQFWLVVTTVPVLLWVGHLLWYLNNDQLSRRWPERFFAVRSSDHRPWWLRLPWFAIRERRLREAGFTEVGVVVERVAFTRCTQWIWWSSERRTWAIVAGPIAWLVETVLVSPLADGSLLVTSPAVPESARIRHVPARGHRIEEHEAHRIELGPSQATRGTLDEAVELVETLHYLFVRPGDGEPEATLDQPPAQVTVDHALHWTRIVFPFRAPWPATAVSKAGFVVLAWQIPSLVRWISDRWPGAAAVAALAPIGSILLVIVGGVFLTRLLGASPTVWLTPDQLIAQPGRQTHYVPLSRITDVRVDGNRLVVGVDTDAGHRVHRWRLGRTELQHTWLAQLIDQARVAASAPVELPEPPRALRSLHRRAKDAPRIE
ncbi:MAG: hypothetical protein AAF211_05830 [Myxococcota bacterium]